MNRRQLLKGVSLTAGSLLLSPVIRQLQAHADGQQTQPRRVVFVLEGNGLNPHQVMPEGMTRPRQNDRTELRNTSLADHNLPRALQPLQP